MMHLFRLAIAGAAFTAVTLTAAGAYPTTLTIKLGAQSGSGETGTATLTQVTGGVNVAIKLGNAGTAAQPAHIHEGTCGKLNPAPKYPLSNVVAGSSVTTVPGITLGDLLKSPFAINVHHNADDLKSYVACGDIVAKPTK